MLELLSDLLQRHREKVYMLLRSYFAAGREFLLRSDLWDGFEQYCGQYDKEGDLCDSATKKWIAKSQEAILEHPWIYFAIRERVG
ncbi:MAG: sucrose synthase, partial [Gammaproteobacteria bacterium]